MRHVGIDIGSRTHVVASIDDAGSVVIKPTAFEENAAGYEKAFGLLGSPEGKEIAVESTGHYGCNLVAALREQGFKVAVINPLRTKRFAQEDLKRAKTDAVDALLLARFAAQKRLLFVDHRDAGIEELRQAIAFHERLTQDIGDRVRRLHRLASLCFPEIPRLLPLKGTRALSVLRAYPTAQALAAAHIDQLAELRGVRQKVGLSLARRLVDAAATSVGRHHGPVYSIEMQHICDALRADRDRLRAVAEDIERRVREHPVAVLLTSIDGIGILTAAQFVGTVGDPARFRDAAALAAYVGVVPGTQHSGLRRPGQAPLSPIGNARLRRALWMPTLTATGRNRWLAPFYQRLRTAGKPGKVAMIAAMRKLVTVIYSVAKSRRPFEPRTK